MSFNTATPPHPLASKRLMRFGQDVAPTPVAGPPTSTSLEQLPPPPPNSFAQPLTIDTFNQSIRSIQTVQPQPPDLFLRSATTRRHLVSSAVALRNMLRGAPSQDYDLSNSEDMALRGATLTIAGLGGMMAGSRLKALNNVIGVTSWLGSMSLIPIGLDALVRARTGVNTSRRYLSSYPVGDENRQAVKPIASDPNYIPLQALTADEHRAIAARTSRLYDENPQDTEKAYLHKIVSQRNAALALVAGGTPLLASMISDVVQEPLKRLLWNFGFQQDVRAIRRLSQQSPEKVHSALMGRTHRLVERTVANQDGSWLATWWRQMTQPRWWISINTKQNPITNNLPSKMAIKTVIPWRRPWNPVFETKNGQKITGNHLFQFPQESWRRIQEHLLSLDRHDRKKLAQFLEFQDNMLVDKEVQLRQTMFETYRVVRYNVLKTMEKVLKETSLSHQEQQEQFKALEGILRHQKDVLMGQKSTRRWLGSPEKVEEFLNNLEQRLSEPILKERIQHLKREWILDPANQSLGHYRRLEKQVSNRFLNARSTIFHMQNLLTLLQHREELIQNNIIPKKPGAYEALVRLTAENPTLPNLKHWIDHREDTPLKQVLGGWIEHHPTVSGIRVGQLATDLSMTDVTLQKTIMHLMDDQRLYNAPRMQFASAFERVGKTPASLITQALQEAWITTRWKTISYGIALTGALGATAYVMLGMRAPKPDTPQIAPPPKRPQPIPS